MNNLSSNENMQNIDDLLRSVKKVEVPEQLYDRIVVRINKGSELYVSRGFVRAAAAVLICMLVTESFVVWNSKAGSSAGVSSLVELPDNSLNYE